MCRLRTSFDMQTFVHILYLFHSLTGEVLLRFAVVKLLR
jgi:hypothetical protein